MRRALLILAPLFAIIVACGASARSAKTQAPCQASCTLHESMDPMPGMTAGPSATAMPNGAAMAGMTSMSGMGAMGLHMTLTSKWSPNPGDAERAARIVATLRTSIEKYQDYRIAEQDGYMPFHAEIPQQQYHFTNWQNAAAALYSFDPTKPTSLLYEKTADGYRLVGAMYTAPRSATLADLDARVPLSVAQWHEHVNFCKAPPDAGLGAYLGRDAKFGLQGSIATADACAAAGGTFIPIIYNWMVHVYPFETDPAQVWRVSH
jgi:hypothetical protein